LLKILYPIIQTQFMAMGSRSSIPLVIIRS
jgi:hypothetical protein